MSTHFTVCSSDVEKLQATVATVKCNLQTLQSEWDKVKTEASTSLTISQVLTPEDVIVSRKSLQRLASEANHMKSKFPRVLDRNFSSAQTKLTHLETGKIKKTKVIGYCLNLSVTDLEKAKRERDSLRTEVVHWKTQAETAVTDVQREKRGQLELRVDVQELTSQLSQQSEFCSSLGAACCTLLWRVSRQEETIHDIVKGTKSEEFLELVSTSVQSYLSAYKDDQWPDQGTDEAIFIIALCGIATNVAASAFGRECLASSSQGKQLVDTFITFVNEAPLEKSANMKQLMLMTLFNISINQKGVKYLQGRPGLVRMLAWHLREEESTECRANTLRLLLSLVSDEASGLRLMHELMENLSTTDLQQLTTNQQTAEVKDLALDLLMDIRRFDTEQ